MAAARDTFSAWLAQARLPEQRLSPDQRGALLAAFHFRQAQGRDSYATRLLTHFLLHGGTGLKPVPASAPPFSSGTRRTPAPS